MIVGKPLALPSHAEKNENANATVTVCIPQSRSRGDYSHRPTYIVAAIGRAGFVKADHVRERRRRIDVGINRVETRAPSVVIAWCGDVAFDEVSKKASAITAGGRAAWADDDRDC
jgi:methylenetetrahydrofolate dehydrogenase (NADP+)/methenyltetrahydrofolate cyclohydrolase